ncbi:gastrula zinc finger protein XlCGF57.1 isoform X2 [Mastacembelus armatus]|uniref:Gastrula zinc finger protein XlCGF57.1-like n=1 Tax=Mastacembelus armatus TaxID=205130 RepID=A0A7N8YEW9_9TELE|nr:gastrula zinc finger protein XlCGF57.1-like isoform X2 [Mastacembelus armatus]
MKDPAKSKYLLKKAHRGERQHDVDIVKSENESEPTHELKEDSSETNTNGDGLNIQIKEEPHCQEISEWQDGDSGCTDTKPDTGTLGHIKDECDCDHQPEYEFTKAAVKEESESWIKQDRADEEEAAHSGNTQGESSSEFFPCPHCTVSFTDLDFLEKHVKWVHQKQYLAKLRKCLSSGTLNLIPKHTCTVCSSTFNSKVHLRVHIREAHPSAPPRRLHPCPTCARSFQYLKNLKNHCQRWHNMSVLTRGGHLSCADCGKSFIATWGQGPHLCHKPNSTEPEDKPICLDTGVQCPECGKKVRTPQSLDDHMRTHTGDRPFVCKDCGRRFVERSGWRQHMKIHTGEKPYKCQVCEKAFLRSHHLKCHLTTHSGKKEYSCSECGKQFGFKSSLDLHLRTHSSEKPFHCNVCGKNFNTKRNLRVHTKLHTNEKAHQCGDCGLKIGDLGALKIHLRTHTGERPYHCTVCGNRFIRLAHLRNHQRTHTGERPYKCNECDKSFTQSGDLVKHKRIHSGEKPFECPDCHRRYTSSGDLGKHRRSHTNLRPYTCQECGKSFRLSGHLKTHMLTHTGEKPYSCPKCLRRFARSHHLSGHLAKCR